MTEMPCSTKVMKHIPVLEVHSMSFS